MMAGYEILPLAIMIIALALAAMGFYKGDKQARSRHPVRAVWQPNPSRRGKLRRSAIPCPRYYIPALNYQTLSAQSARWQASPHIHAAYGE